MFSTLLVWYSISEGRLHEAKVITKPLKVNRKLQEEKKTTAGETKPTP